MNQEQRAGIVTTKDRRWKKKENVMNDQFVLHLKDFCKERYNNNSFKMDCFMSAMDAISREDWDSLYDTLQFNATVAADVFYFREAIIPIEIKCKIAVACYERVGNELPIIRKYVRMARPYRPRNWRDQLPDSVKNLDSFVVYRGGGEQIGKAQNSLSWTLCQEIAEWFMLRHGYTHPGEQFLYKGIIQADKVIAYIDGRFEFEIVQYRNVKSIEIIKPSGISDEYYEIRNNHSTDRTALENDYFNRWYYNHL